MSRDRNNKDSRIRLLVRLLALVAFILVFWWLAFAEKDNHIGLETSNAIHDTPQQIQLIKDIGEWEFLSVSDEELVDTIRKGLLSDDHLVRIYYGTLRLGIDLSHLDSTAISSQGDILLLHLPDVGLLDDDFIDEARTRSFHESGTWSNKDREDLYERARQRMKARCITPEALSSTRQQAEMQISQMLQAMGFEKTVIDFNAPLPNND